MLNKKGFISISVVYSFFVVFLALMLFIVNGLINNRGLLNRIENQIKDEISVMTFARYLSNNAEELGLVHHNSNLKGGALDNSYRYVGSNPNNYICIGSTAATCPANNLFRIIGVINDQVRVIKSSSYQSAPISTNSTSYFINTNMYNTLNTTYLNSVRAFENLIDISRWYVGGFDESFSSENIKVIYDNEVGAKRNDPVHVDAKIGLLYISDYAYATSDAYTGSVTGSNNWLNTGQQFWAMSRVSNYNNRFFYFGTNGTLGMADVATSMQVRPVFNLVSTVRLVSGNGTSATPYRIEG